MLTIAICDDCQTFAKELEKKLSTICTLQVPEQVDYRILPAFSSAKELLASLDQHPIDILFLDIEMPVMNGFTAAKQLREHFPDMLLIFVSSYEDRVYSSFSYGPFWFLRKDHINEELPSILQQAISNRLFNAESILFQTTDGEVVLHIKEILYFETEHNYYSIYCISGIKYTCRGSLASLEKKMLAYNFYRIHHAYLINMMYITQLLPANMVLMKNNIQIPVSRPRLPAFKKAYSEFIRRRITL